MRAPASRILVVGAAATLLASRCSGLIGACTWDGRVRHSSSTSSSILLPSTGRVAFGAPGRQVPVRAARAVRAARGAERVHLRDAGLCRGVFSDRFKNPTRTSYDFFDNPNGRVERIKKALEDHDVNAVVINQTQVLLVPATGAHVVVRRALPWSIRFGAFQILWRGELPPDSSAALPNRQQATSRSSTRTFSLCRSAESRNAGFRKPWRPESSRTCRAPVRRWTSTSTSARPATCGWPPQILKAGQCVPAEVDLIE